jgi:hypothetical protein
MTQPTSTADYRKYPKGPNFLLIVILFVVTIVIVGICAYFVLRAGGTKLIPKVPDKHPTSQIIPFAPPVSQPLAITRAC